MAAPQQAPLPPFFTLSSGYVVRLTALDATTGAVVAGVVVSGRSLDVDPVTSEPATQDPMPGTAFAFGDVAA